MKHPQLACALLALMDSVRNPVIKEHKEWTVKIIIVLPYMMEVGIATTKENIHKAIHYNVTSFHRVMLSMVKDEIVFLDNKRYYLTEKGKGMNKVFNDRFFEYMDKTNKR